MTCEVAVMNSRGIALAADSVVSFGKGAKLHTSAEKLFPLVPPAPVGIMTFGTASLMGVPWEILIADYTRRFGGNRFAKLSDYAEDFVRFVEGSEQVFPEELQRERYLHHVRAICDHLYLQPLKAELRKKQVKNGTTPEAILWNLIREDHEKWMKDPALEDMSAEFVETVTAEYGSDIAIIEAELFGEFELDDDFSESLRTTAGYFLSRASFPGSDDTGLVIAGMGEEELFPSLVCYQVGCLVNNRLRRYKVQASAVAREGDSNVTPFGQCEMIDLVIQGIHPALADLLPGIVKRSVDRPRRGAESRPPEHSARKETRFRKLLGKEIQKRHTTPFMETVAAMPRHDLAGVAEALVNFTAFGARTTAEHRQTVGGPIDVAIMSKCDGFVWVKRKSLLA